MTELQPDAGTDLRASVGTWRLDPTATSVHLRTKAMWGTVTVKATLRATEGAGVVAADGSVSGSLVVDAASIDTALAKRNTHLRSSDFLDVERYPALTYSVTSAVPSADNAVAFTGTLAAHGQTRPLTVHGTVDATHPGRITVTARAEVDRSQWGIGSTRFGARLDNHLDVVAVFVRS